MINNTQKALIHIYKATAKLDDPSYRNLLREYAGVSSAADRRFTQAGFERVMAALETVLFERVHRGRIMNPLYGESRYITKEFHWRGRLPAEGYINSRQICKIEDLWARLCASLPGDKQTLDYLAAIIRKATGEEHVGFGALTSTQASHLIDALRDRINYARLEKDELVPF